MKKCLIVSLSILIIMCFPIVVFADISENIFHNDEEQVELKFPEKFHMITPQNMGSHQKYIEEKGTNAESLEKNFKESGILVCGYTDDGAQELFISATADKISQNIFSMNRYTSEELEKQLESFVDPALEKVGIYTNNDVSYVECAKTKFLRGSFENRYDPDNPIRVFQYYTMMNGKYYSISLYDYVQTDFDLLGKQLDEIMSKFEFTQILQPEKERVTQLATGKIVSILIMACMILGIILLVLFMHHSDKKKERFSTLKEKKQTLNKNVELESNSKKYENEKES